jgi:glycine cleavage system H lipoate-binding protein
MGSEGVNELITYVGYAVLDGLKYASSHEWVKHEGPVATIGITDHAQV